MSVLFLVNNSRALDPIKATTKLVRRQAEREPTWITACADLTVHASHVQVRARRVVPGQLALGEVETFSQDAFRTVAVRANPAGLSPAWSWNHGLTALEHVERFGVPVLNSVAGLHTFHAKPGLLRLSEQVRPPTVLAGTLPPVLEAVAQFGRSVVKPAHGSHGEGVFVVQPGAENLKTAVELLLQHGPVIVQPWLPAAVDGDVRVFVADGRPFTVGGRVAALRRRPAVGELRSNVHLGGVPEVVDPAGLLDLATQAAEELLAQGIRFAGLDCIGDRIVEANVCAPGGLVDMSQTYGVDFLDPWLDLTTGFDPATMTNA